MSLSVQFEQVQIHVISKQLIRCASTESHRFRQNSLLLPD